MAFTNSIECVNQKNVDDYLIYLSKQKVSNSFLNTTVSGLKFFYKNVSSRPNIFVSAIKRPKKVHKLPRVLSKEEVLRMIGVTDNLKHRTILFALYSSGLRLGELLALKITDIQWDRNQLFIESAKGKKDRVVQLSTVLKDALQIYFHEYKPVYWLFESTVAGKQYSSRSVQSIVKKAARLANISQNVSPHTLRHCFATHLHDGGISIKIIQELLGHKDVKTTMIYTHVSNTSIQSIESPLDSLFKNANKG